MSSLVILFFSLFLSGTSANDRPSRTAPEQYMVVRGERPPIDKNTISPEATESGVLLVKFKEAIGNLLDAQPPTTDKDGQVRFNMEGIDSANALLGLQHAAHYFFDPALKTSFSDRHRAWGFHVWYKFDAYPGEDGRIALRFGPFTTDKAVMLNYFLFRHIHEPLLTVFQELWKNQAWRYIPLPDSV